ncbi:energy-coupling factor transporter ATPase [Microbacterium sp. NPDC064584]|uniref:ABC transporter ATP-binding protein n=1 Tax=Microbacterium sp. NPDC064584 TaxID=3155817 RepID=UPI00342E0EFB
MTASERDPSAPAPERPSPILRVHEVAITHAGETTPAPADVSFDVAVGEVVLLLGPSGSGKSTLTLALDGLIPHAVPATVTGRIEVAGRDTASASVAELSTHVGMVFQDPDAQLVTGTLLDEVAFGPENLRMPVQDVLARAERALRRVGLWERRGENPDRLSGGGRQRLAIACALAMGSPLLVLDEPTANLDPQGIDEVYAALKELVSDGAHAIVLVEHDLDAAVGFVDRVVVLDQAGRLVADGPVDAVLRDRAEELHALGVWLPTSTLAGLRLRRAGYALDPLPLTPDELRAALEDAPAPASVPVGRVIARRAARMPDERPVIAVRALTLRRGRDTVLRDIDLDVARGEFIAVVGGNGAGKTTLVQAIAGVIVPPRRAVRIDGRDVARLGARELTERVGFVFQNPEHQFIAATVAAELAHGLRRRGLDDDAVRARTAEVLDRFGLSEKAESHPFLLSGGQKRRLSVATALVTGAPVLVLDEPTFGQDRARADELLGLLSELNDAGTTIVFVTHDMQLVAEYADRLVVLADGRLIAHGSTAEVFGDRDVVARAGLRLPPLARALSGVARHPELAGISRLKDLPEATS